MPHPGVVTAVQNRLEALWSHAAECPVIDANTEPGPPTGSGKFLMVQYPVSTTRKVAVGDRLFEEVGGFLLRLMVEKGSGADVLTEWGAELARMFRRTKFDGLDCRDATGPRLGDDNETAGYYGANVVVQYSFQFREEPL